MVAIERLFEILPPREKMVARPAHQSVTVAGRDSDFHCQLRHFLGSLSIALTHASARHSGHLAHSHPAAERIARSDDPFPSSRCLESLLGKRFHVDTFGSGLMHKTCDGPRMFEKISLPRRFADLHKSLKHRAMPALILCKHALPSRRFARREAEESQFMRYHRIRALIFSHHAAKSALDPLPDKLQLTNRPQIQNESAETKCSRR